MNAKLLPNLLTSIERNLTDWIPIGVKELEITSPAYCLFIWYQDYSGDLTPHIGVATKNLLDAVEATDFEDPNDKYDMIWRPQQCADLEIPGRLIVDECDIVENEVEDCYELLAEKSGLFDGGDDDSDDDDDLDEDEEDEDEIEEDSDLEDDEIDEELDEEFQTLAPFREMMHRVGKNLANVDWSKIMPVTDEFVVLVCDYVGYWLPEDFEQCVTDAQFDKLVARGLLLPLDTETP
jgi:hypothetical protein